MDGLVCRSSRRLVQTGSLLPTKRPFVRRKIMSGLAIKLGIVGSICAGSASATQAPIASDWFGGGSTWPTQSYWQDANILQKYISLLMDGMRSATLPPLPERLRAAAAGVDRGFWRWRAKYPERDLSPRPDDGRNLALSIRKLTQGSAPERPFLIWGIGPSYLNFLGDGTDLACYLRQRFPHAPPIVYRARWLLGALALCAGLGKPRGDPRTTGPGRPLRHRTRVRSGTHFPDAPQAHDRRHHRGDGALESR